MMTLKTAFRSLLSHKSKTIVLLSILIFGSFLTLTGLSFMYTFVTNLRTGLTQAVSGDIVVHSSFTKGKPDVILPLQRVPEMRDYDKIIEVLEENDQVEYITPLIRDAAFIVNPETKEFDFGLPVVGSEVDNYMKVFSNAIITAKVDYPVGEYDPDADYDILMTEGFLKSLPKGRSNFFTHIMPDDLKEELLKSLPEDTIKVYRDLSEEKKESNFIEFFTKDQKEKFIDSLDEERKFNIVKDYYNKNYGNIKVVDKIDAVDGGLIPEGVPGVVLSKIFLETAQSNNERFIDYKDSLRVGGKIKLQSLTRKGSMSITELRILGVVDIPSSDFSYMSNVIDMKTFQKIAGLDAESRALTVEQKLALMKNEDLFDLEGDEIFDNVDSMFDEEESDEEESDEEEISTEGLEDDTVSGVGSTDYVTARIKNPSMMYRVVDQLNKTFEDKGYDFKASGYVEASGNLGAFISLLGVIVTAIIFIIQIISIIIIANSVLMGILERVNEIGTMRAIGAQRGYVFRLIFTESFLLALIATIIGVALSLLALWVVRLIGFKSVNFITSILFGGERLLPVTTIYFPIITVIVIVVSTFLATLYPVMVATKISPLEAMNRT